MYSIYGELYILNGNDKFFFSSSFSFTHRPLTCKLAFNFRNKEIISAPLSLFLFISLLYCPFPALLLKLFFYPLDTYVNLLEPLNSLYNSAIYAFFMWKWTRALMTSLRL